MIARLGEIRGLAVRILFVILCNCLIKKWKNMVNYNDSSKMLEEKAKIKSIVESLSLEEKEGLLKELQRLKSLSELNIAKQILLKMQIAINIPNQNI